ncbi:MAG TPA: AAA family ATPase, partial [Actinocrinis sp.]|nr:AAA family ATPase [Actinocrinis sp.]
MKAGAFVGRAREIDQLMQLLDQAARKNPITAVLAGEAGVGKSRLLAEFTDRARDTGAHVLRGACIELGDGVIPYAPLVEALRLLVRAHGEERVRELAGPAWDDLAGLVVDFTGSAPATESDGGTWDRLHVFGTVLRLLDHLGDTAPVLLVFEDMHWADQSTLDLVSYLTRNTSIERMLLVCSHRTGLAASHALRLLLAEPDFVRRVHRIQVPRFTETELRQFLYALGPVDRDVLRTGYQLSEGNAFFAEQLMASGALTDPAARRIPESINELMLVRIGGLSRPANRVMKVAATAARRVSDRLLTAVCRLDEEALDDALRECLDEGLLVADPVDETYVVRHALLRSAVYENMIPRERRRLHTEMAEAITADADLSLDDDLSGVELAHHWSSARRYPEALAAAVHAGEMTARLKAFHESEAQYRSALQLWDRVAEAECLGGMTRGELLAGAANAARWAGHVVHAVGFIEEALAAVDAVAHPRAAGELYERLGSYRWEAGALDEAHRAYEEAKRLLESAGPPDEVYARVLAALATAEVQSGAYARGLRQARHAAETAEAVGATAAQGRALNTAGVALTMLGRAEEGERLLREALDIATRTDHLEDLFRAYGNLGVALEHTGNLSAAVDVALAGLQRARELGLAGARQGGLLANNASAAQLLLGRWDEAAELLNEVLLDHPPVTQSTYLRLTLAEIEVARGHFTEAEQLISEVWNQGITDPRFVAPLYACEAELHCWRGESALALDTVDRGLAVISDTENTLVHLRLCAMGLRAAADRCAQDDDSTAAMARGMELFDQAVLAAGSQPELREVVVLLRLCEVERHRVLGIDSAAGWAQIAEAWDNLERPYPAAYAHWRQAAKALEAGDSMDARQAAQAAADTTALLRAEPLATEVAKVLAPLTPTPAPTSNPESAP